MAFFYLSACGFNRSAEPGRTSRLCIPSCRRCRATPSTGWGGRGRKPTGLWLTSCFLLSSLTHTFPFRSFHYISVFERHAESHVNLLRLTGRPWGGTRIWQKSSQTRTTTLTAENCWRRWAEAALNRTKCWPAWVGVDDVAVEVTAAGWWKLWVWSSPALEVDSDLSRSLVTSCIYFRTIFTHICADAVWCMTV